MWGDCACLCLSCMMCGILVKHIVDKEKSQQTPASDESVRQVNVHVVVMPSATPLVATQAWSTVTLQ